MLQFARLVLPIIVLLAAMAAPAAAQTAPPANAAAATAQVLDEDLRFVPAEPDFALSTLPTTLRMPVGKYTFRLTHRFQRPIGEGNAGDFFSDFFGLDSSATVGFELRYGIRPGTQALVHRTSDRTIALMGQHEILRQTDERPYTITGLLAIDGRNNFGLSDEIAIPGGDLFTTTLGAIVSHQFAGRGAVYAEPLVVFNANVDPTLGIDSEHTLMLGLGGRMRLAESDVYLLAEVVPRVAGFDAGVDQISVGIEKRVRGHVFQFNVSNSLGTTMGQIARGGFTNDDWFIGFNLTRRFW